MTQAYMDGLEANDQSINNLDSTFFNKEHVQKLHGMAYVYYQNQHYREADALFRLLISCDPQNSKYWKGLGACLQMKKNYQAALDCYRQVKDLLLDQADVYLDIHCADCYFALNQVTEGLHTLSEARQKALKNGDKKVLKHVAFMRSRWKEKPNHNS